MNENSVERPRVAAEDGRRRALREVAGDRRNHTKPQKGSEALLRTDVQSHQSGLLGNSRGLEEEGRKRTGQEDKVESYRDPPQQKPGALS